MPPISFFCSSFNITDGCWAVLVDAVGFMAQFCGTMHVSKAYLLDFEVQIFLNVCQLLSILRCCILTPISGLCRVFKVSKRREVKHHSTMAFATPKPHLRLRRLAILFLVTRHVFLRTYHFLTDTCIVNDIHIYIYIMCLHLL